MKNRITAPLAWSMMIACTLLAGCLDGGRAPGDTQAAIDPDGFVLKVLSNRADLISGGDVLIGLESVTPIAPESIELRVNGTVRPNTLQEDAAGRLRGLVSGLVEGQNTITARSSGMSHSVSLVNHPSSGPLFSGPQLQPWTCLNEGALDEHCNQAPEYQFFYKPAEPALSGFQPYDPDNPPANIAQVTTDNGTTLDFIVRIETGYMNRDQYRVAVLYQPDLPWTALNPQPQYAHRLVINHGFSCNVEYQSGEAPDVTPPDTTNIPVLGNELLPFPLPIEVLTNATEMALGKGYAVMSTALSNSRHNCNIALQAESLVMAKERVVEQYGDLRYTIGQGCSGGSLATQWIANAYPGIYQGILPTCSFPDAWSTATQFMDYHLTLNYFTNPAAWGAGVIWTPLEMAAAQGHLTIVNSQISDNALFNSAVPTAGCEGLAEGEIYHPQNNPGGVRCAIQDAVVNLLGPRPERFWSEKERLLGRGFGGVPLDNVGVQYGLEALKNGQLLPAQFVDLNAKIGGLDVDANVIPERLEGAVEIISNAYRSGLINQANHLNRTAIIDCRGPDPGAFHDAYRAYAIRARLDRAHGHHDNQVIWEGPLLIVGDNECARNSFVAMERWLNAVEQDDSDTALPQKLAQNKPDEVTDACYDGIGQRLLDTTCGELIVGIYGTPRTVAGDAISTDTNKCQLKPLNRSDDYGPLPFTDAQWAQLQTTFPDGVCDFSQPGIAQQDTLAWQRYADDNGAVIYGGAALPTAPARSGGSWASPVFDAFSIR